MSRHLNPELSAEIRENAIHLPPYKGGPAVSYKDADTAYAANVTVLHTPYEGETTPQTEALIVKRGSSDGIRATWSGVSGYVDVMHDPAGKIPEEEFDPVAFAARKELVEECSFPKTALDALTLHLGKRFEEVRQHSILHVLPLLGVYVHDEKPVVTPDGVEVTDYDWVPLERIADRAENLAPDYLTHTLPRALGARGIAAIKIYTLLGL